MPWHEFDKGSKWLIQHHGDSILRLGGVCDVVRWRALQAEVIQPSQLPDGLLEVQLAGQKEPDLFVLEIGTSAEPRLTEQTLRDLMLVYLERRVLPEVVLLVLHHKGNYRAAAEIAWQSRLGLSRCQVGWRVVELWALSAEELLATNDVRVIPWVPLTSYAGPPHPLVQQCRERIDQHAIPNERANLLAVTQVMTRLRYNDPVLLTILGGEQVMIESPLIQEMRHRDILRVLRTRLGGVPQDVVIALQAIYDAAKLDELVEIAASCPDWDTFRERLRA